MIKIEIKNRWTGTIIFSYEKENNTMKETVKEFIRNELSKGKSWADLSKADLSKANLSKADLSEANLSEADLSKADLSKANLSKADLSEANLSKANLSWADLSEANLSKANLSKAKNDLWVKLLKLKNEIPAFKEKLIAGEIDGSCYEGTCCCFVGTFANIQGKKYTDLLVKNDSSSPIERWFLGIRKGDTPEKSQIAKITLEWIEEFEMFLNAK